MDIPWVEKYRPCTFREIVLHESNQQFFNNVMASGNMPNVLFHGPPGTGKTTTIMNMIRSYQEAHHECHKGLMLHLNASDERGIETIRTQIYTFVHTKPLFSTGTKFVILDEVDSMTKTAQQAMCSMLQSHLNVRFCLICNYVSRIDVSLQSMFIKIKFNKLPTRLVVEFLSRIVEKENLGYTQEHLLRLQKLFGSDLRSMVNYLQSNRTMIPAIITTSVWESLYSMVLHSDYLAPCVDRVYDISRTYNMSLQHVMKDFMFYVWTTQTPTASYSGSLGLVFHNPNVNVDHMVRYVLLLLQPQLKVQ